jgi:hypothetical protein
MIEVVAVVPLCQNRQSNNISKISIGPVSPWTRHFGTKTCVSQNMTDISMSENYITYETVRYPSEPEYMRPNPAPTVVSSSLFFLDNEWRRRRRRTTDWTPQRLETLPQLLGATTFPLVPPAE